MRLLKSCLVIVLVACLAPACGGGGGGGNDDNGIEIAAIAPLPFVGSIATPFAISGADFLSAGQQQGTNVTVRFIVQGGETPFAGGTSATADVVGTIDSDTSISGTTPDDAIVPGTLNALVRVIFQSGDQATSATPIAVFVGVLVTAIDPTVAPSEIPGTANITGEGFVSNTGLCNVTLRAQAGTPFALGTIRSLTVVGIVTSPTNVRVTTPIAGVQVVSPVFVDIALPNGAEGSSQTPLIQFLPPAATDINPPVVASETPTLVTISGVGFAGGSPTIRFVAQNGTPFLGGTAAFVDVPGAIVNEFTITCTTPLFELAADEQPHVDVRFTGGIVARLGAGALTLDAP